jgi:hypothetical protein
MRRVTKGELAYRNDSKETLMENLSFQHLYDYSSESKHSLETLGSITKQNTIYIFRQTMPLSGFTLDWAVSQISANCFIIDT